MDDARVQVERISRFRSILWSGYMDGDWRDRAACADVETGVFFPVGTTGTAVAAIEVARAICETCLVRSDCLRFAVASNQQHGVWGGLDEEERRQLRRLWAAGRVDLDPASAPHAAAS